MVQSILRKENTVTDERSVDSLKEVKQIVWGDITIYEFSNILGDNPAVSNGSPLTIAWEHDTENTFDVNFYEFVRQNSNPRRRKKDLVMKPGERDS